MLNLYDLRLLTAFDELGTLSRAAESLHISTPSATRAMQSLEECFAVPLFNRGKNRIELNETGKLAVEYAHKLLREADEAVNQVRAFSQRRRTIVVRSCAPAPMWELLHKLNSHRPDMTISYAVCQNAEVLSAWEDGSCDIAILPFDFEGAEPFMQERLYVCVPEAHELAGKRSLTFADINGFNFLLRSQLGFWDTLCREKMPASKFLVQTDPSVFDELVKASSLPCFSTDYGQRQQPGYPGRVNIPMSDNEVQVTFYIAERNTVRG